MSLLHFFIRFTLYLIAIIGLWLIVWPLIERSIKDMAKRMDYRMKQRARSIGLLASQYSNKSRLYQHIDNLLYITKDYEANLSTTRFFIRLVFLFVGVFIICFMTFSELPTRLSFENPFTTGIQIERVDGGITWIFPLLVSILITLIPYFRLRYVYSLRKIRASYDLLEVIQIYTKFSYISIDAALDKTANLLSDGNVLRQPIRLLSHVFSNYTSIQELRDEIRRFNRVVDTTFAIQFTSDLLYAEREGNHFLRESLTNLKEEMEHQRASILDVRSNSRDAIQMGIWGNILVLILCSGSLAIFIKPDIYMRLQFHTKTGLIFISLILIGLFISFIISYVLSRPKLDYK